MIEETGLGLCQGLEGGREEQIDQNTLQTRLILSQQAMSPETICGFECNAMFFIRAYS